MTLATNDSYSLGALVVAHSLKRVSTLHQLAVLITPGVTEQMKTKLEAVFDVVQLVDVLDSKDAANLAVLKRPELGITFTKLHCWNLTQFEKCVFLDADVLVRFEIDVKRNFEIILISFLDSSKLRRALRARRVLSCSRHRMARLLQFRRVRFQAERRHLRKADSVRRL